MKNPGSVRHKIKQVRFRHLQKRLEAELRPLPENCRYNSGPFDGHQVPSSPNDGGARYHQPMSICLFGAHDPSSWKPRFCDSRWPETAKNCGDFCPRRSKEEIKEDFRLDLAEMSFPELAYRYPDLAALVWVLDDDDITEEEGEEEESQGVDSPEEPAPLVPILAVGTKGHGALPWWKKLLTGLS